MNFGIDRLIFFLNRLREHLWVRPLVVCLVSIAGVFALKFADRTPLRGIAPDISMESIEILLSIMASSMLVVATFTVGSMVAAYASTSNTATPRSFRLVIADDVSQNALSTFIGAFIFSIVALAAAKNDFFQTAGRFALFIVTASVFALVVVTFVKWVDRIARLGRLGTTIDKVEDATTAALLRRRKAPTLGGAARQQPPQGGAPVFAPTIGYVQHVDIESLQAFATETRSRVVVAALPGTFAAPDRPLAYISGNEDEVDDTRVTQAFAIGGERVFDNDPRFGLVVLSEIAGRALSPGINDPGTAIDIIGTLVRLFSLWIEPVEADDAPEPAYDRVEVPEISVHDLFDDAFTAIARDGAGIVEVAIRLQKALESLASLDDAAVREAAIHHARMALKRSEKALDLPEEIAAVRALARFATAGE